jgi:thiol:disulfide interchange protein DsbD
MFNLSYLPHYLFRQLPGLPGTTRYNWLVILSLLVFLPAAHAVSEADLPPPEQVFALTVTAQDADTLVAQWSIAEGYYLYRNRVRFTSNTPGVRLGEPHFPAGKIKEDEFSGRIETYRGTLRIEIPLQREAQAPQHLELKTVFQGCADIGFCYPPQTQTTAVDLPASSTLAAAVQETGIPQSPAMEPVPPSASPPKLLTGLKSRENALLNQSQDSLLEPDQAFMPSVTATAPRTLTIRWDIADGYYLYKDKLKLSLLNAGDLRIQAVDLPAGKVTEDEFFGHQEVFYRQATATAHLQGSSRAGREIEVQVAYQGCAEIGVCYPPITRILPVTLAALSAAVPPAAAGTTRPVPAEAEQDRMARLLTEQRFWAAPAFFGFGVLLAFTPCVFPMVPILSRLIAGQGKYLNTRRALALSLVYVLAMAVTYTVAGVLAALLGQNIQALFQNPWVLAGFSALFVLLALSMFGFYELQLPASWQNRLTELSHRQRGGSFVGVAGMGLLSALIVSPCVAPPLIGVLTVIASTGDALLGACALFALSLGMGAPLLLVGTSVGHWLPKAGYWMERIQAVFGVLLLAVALWMLERILPVAVTMLLWAVLLIVCAIYMGALQPVDSAAPGWRILVKGLGMVLLIYGILLLVGMAAGGRDVLRPLRGVSFSAGATPTHPSFHPVKTLADLEQKLQQAGGRPVILDFYADWCVSCQEMNEYTFGDAGVQAALRNVLVLQADVTANDDADQTLLHHFGILGPPVTLFFGADGRERKAYRVVGFMAAERFKAHLDQILQLP